MNLRYLLTAACLASTVVATAAAARTPAQTQAIVEQFSAAFGGSMTADQLGALMSDDFIEHHPTAGTPERTKPEFIARFAANGSKPKRMGKPPAPIVTEASEEYVLLMTPRAMTAPKTAAPYEAFSFDLFRVDAAGKVAEHWDSWTLNDTFGPPKK